MVREASFKLTELQPRTLSHALSQLTMPNLESLDTAVCRTANASNLCFGIKSLLLRSKCSLTSLSLWFSSAWHPGSDDTVHLADLLSTIPELRHLSLKINNLDNAFLHALAIIPGSADFEPEHNLCPGLESISVAECQSLESFFQMVASRWRAGRTLRKFSLTTSTFDTIGDPKQQVTFRRLQFAFGKPRFVFGRRRITKAMKAKQGRWKEEVPLK
ncbi:hypothetical protein DFH11DRAFT_1830695 [Phellopilus nigrolimitatus]|nr:hypothetical protein DFH11DRAFT_1830695 [Phellopilus nigrolimitatus]